MKVIEITGEPILHGGQEAFLFDCIKNIQDTSINIDLLTPYYCQNNYYKQILLKRGGSLYELNLPFVPFKSRRAIFKPILDFLKKKNYDVVHVHSGSISVLAYVSLAAKLAGAEKIIVHSHSTGINNFKHFLVKTIFTPILSVCPDYYCGCSEKAGFMKFPKLIVKKKLIILKNGIDLDKFRFNHCMRDTIRRKLKIDKKTIVIGHVGRFAFEKNQAFLVEIFKEYHNINSNSVLVFVGDGELIDDVKEKVNSFSLADCVLFIGAVDDIWNYYSVMDIFALPSLYEGFSLVSLEAQACGLPCVISSDVPSEVCIGANIARVALSDKNDWIKKLNDYSVAGLSDNTNVIRKKGYDIYETVKELEKLYN